MCFLTSRATLCYCQFQSKLLTLLEVSGCWYSLLPFLLLLPDKEKGWNKPGAEVMIDDTPPPVYTSLLTHFHTATLFNTNWATLQTLLPVHVSFWSKPTTHSARSLNFTDLPKKKVFLFTVDCVFTVNQGKFR